MKQKGGVSKISTELMVLGIVVAVGALYLIFAKSTQTKTIPAGLTAGQIKTANYTLPDIGGSFTFNDNGEYATSVSQGKGAVTPTITETAALMSNQIAFGDLNSDGKNDAAVPVVEQLGGSGSFYYIVIFLDDNGKPKEVGTKLLGDRIVVNSVKIENSQVAVAMLDHGPSDGMASATMPITKYFGFVDNAITETDPNVRMYISSKLGITFNYYETPGMPEVRVSEKGDKISVNNQSVEVFSKDPSYSLTEAIAKQFLAGYPSNDCFVSPLQYQPGFPPMPDNFVIAIINYPPPPDSNEPFWYNSSKCPADYSATNGIRYFAMDKNHPDRFMFFNIGQYFIDGDGSGTPWQETVQVLPLAASTYTSDINTSDWSAFTNDKYGIQIIYPANDWKAENYGVACMDSIHELKGLGPCQSSDFIGPGIAFTSLSPYDPNSNPTTINILEQNNDLTSCSDGETIMIGNREFCRTSTNMISYINQIRDTYGGALTGKYQMGPAFNDAFDITYQEMNNDTGKGIRLDLLEYQLGFVLKNTLSSYYDIMKAMPSQATSVTSTGWYHDAVIVNQAFMGEDESIAREILFTLTLSH